MSTAVSPLAPTNVPDMPQIAGVRLATAAAGIRYKNRTDVLLALFDKGTTVAGVFTKSKCPSAAVDWCRDKLKGGEARALVVNSGNANAFTGKTGKQATTLTASIAAKATSSANRIFLASTGVIGEPLDATKFNGVLDDLAKKAALAAGRSRPRDHDHRHLPEGRDRDGETRQGQGHHQRHGQGRGHDRARHGDDAVLHLHRRTDLGRHCSRCSRPASMTHSTP
jgi:hypothetical protein